MERDMASIIFSAKDIFEQEFGREVRGYSKAEVDEFLDDVIKDYETYAALVKSLRQEIADLKEELSKNCTHSLVNYKSWLSKICLPNTSFSRRFKRFKISKFVIEVEAVTSIESG